MITFSYFPTEAHIITDEVVLLKAKIKQNKKSNLVKPLDSITNIQKKKIEETQEHVKYLVNLLTNLRFHPPP